MDEQPSTDDLWIVFYFSSVHEFNLYTVLDNWENITYQWTKALFAYMRSNLWSSLAQASAMHVVLDNMQTARGNYTNKHKWNKTQPTSEQMLSWHTWDQTCGPVWPRPRQRQLCWTTCTQHVVPTQICTIQKKIQPTSGQKLAWHTWGQTCGPA